MDVEGNTAIWLISNTDTDIVGQGEAQFTYAVNDQVKKTVIYKTKVDKSLIPSSETAPDAYDNWLERIAQLASQVSVDKAQALQEISTAKTDALDAIQNRSKAVLSDIADEREDSLSSISQARLGALSALESARQSAVVELDGKVDEAERFAQSAGDSADDASGYADSARISAEEARAYAENLHFSDDGSGNIQIKIGG